MSKRYHRRRDLLERHAKRTGLCWDPEVLEQAALAITARFPRDEARELLHQLGLLSPAGPAPIQVRLPGTPRFEKAIPHAHHKRGRAK